MRSCRCVLLMQRSQSVGSMADSKHTFTSAATSKSGDNTLKYVLGGAALVAAVAAGAYFLYQRRKACDSNGSDDADGQGHDHAAGSPLTATTTGGRRSSPSPSRSTVAKAYHPRGADAIPIEPHGRMPTLGFGTA